MKKCSAQVGAVLVILQKRFWFVCVFLHSFPLVKTGKTQFKKGGSLYFVSVRRRNIRCLQNQPSCYLLAS